MIFDAQTEASISKVAMAAFLANIGIDGLMALNVDGLVAFRDRSAVSADDMNRAWTGLQAMQDEEESQRAKAIEELMAAFHGAA